LVDSPGDHRAIAEKAARFRLPIHITETLNKAQKGRALS